MLANRWRVSHNQRFSPIPITDKTACVQTAARKRNQVQAAGCLGDLRIPPGNRLEALKGDRKGQHGIRINDQWRICFRWTTAGPDAVEIVDYH
jgi:proteic killer suppression protein